MERILISENQILIKIKKVPVFITCTLFLVTFLFFVTSIFGLLINFILDIPFHFMLLIGTALFIYLRYYLLKISLWNTYGEEIIDITQEKISYTPNYKWFKAKTKSIENANIKLEKIKVGYEEDDEWALKIVNNQDEINTVIKLKEAEIENLIHRIKLR